MVLGVVTSNGDVSSNKRKIQRRRLPADSGDRRAALDPGSHGRIWVRLLARLSPHTCSKEDAGVGPAEHAPDVDQGVLTAELPGSQPPGLLCLG